MTRCKEEIFVGYAKKNCKNFPLFPHQNVAKAILFKEEEMI